MDRGKSLKVSELQLLRDLVTRDVPEPEDTIGMWTDPDSRLVTREWVEDRLVGLETLGLALPIPAGGTNLWTATPAGEALIWNGRAAGQAFHLEETAH